MDKRLRNACIVQKSSIVEGYYHKIPFNHDFDKKCLDQNEKNERVELLRMNEDMQKLAIKHFVEIVTELMTRCGQQNQEGPHHGAQIVAEMIMTQLRKSMGPILS